METAGTTAASPGAKGETRRVELDRAEQTLTRRMAESKATIPHTYLRATVDMTRAVEIRGAFAAAAAAGEPEPSTADMVVKAVALALREHPRANGSYRGGELELYSRINVGIAVTSGESLAVPTIVDANQLSLGEIAAEARRLAGEVQSGQATAAALAGGTFTVFDLGGFGVRDFDPVIFGGQAGALGVGAVAERPWIREGGPGKAQLMEVTLACDHRILYGASAAAFLASIRRNLEEPDRLA